MRVLIVLIVSVLFSSCEKLVFEDDPSTDNVTSFDYCWSELDRKYSLFDHKQVDWDAIYTQYRPQVNDDMSRVELFDVMGAMLNELRDGHVNLRSDFDISRYERWFSDFPANYNSDVLIREYWGSYRIDGPLIHTIIDSVGYIRYSTFGADIPSETLDRVYFRFRGLKGMIIDIRNNEGGNPANAFNFLERIVNEERLIYRHAFKTGPGREDFEPLQDIFLKPEYEKVRFDGEVIILTNRRCYSASTYFAAMCIAFDNVIQMGDRTGGGGGVPAGSELPNGFHVNYSSSISFLPDGTALEDGIEPDFFVESPDEELAQGIDRILETALDYFQ
jgi:hypothetical protein